MTGIASDPPSGSEFTDQPGLQPERTSLAWQRTTMGLLINGGLLVLKESRQPPNVIPKLMLALLAFIVAATCAVLGWRRSRVLASILRPTDLAPSREVLILGWAIVVFGVGCVIVLLLPG